MNGESGKIWYGIGIDNSQLELDARKSSQIFEGIGDTVEAEGARIDNTFRRIAVTAGGVFTAQQAINFGKALVDTRGQIAAYEVSFETMLGSAEKGKTIFSELRDYAVNTPLLLGDLADGAQMLLSFNVEAEKVMPILKQIGDISMGNAQKFNSLTLAFSQMYSTGKLMGQDLLQMINAGFNPLTVIAEKTGKSIGELKKEMETGAISAEMVADAFATVTAEGGKFHGMLEKQSKEINGMKSNFEGAVDDMFNEIGQNHQGAIQMAIGGATELVKHYEAVGTALGALIAVYGVHKAALIAQDVFYKSAEKAKYVASTLAEGEALKSLETVEIKEQLAKQGLKAGSVEYAAALKAEVFQKFEAQKATYQLAASEATAAQATYKAALQRSLAAKQSIWRHETDLALAKAEGNQSKINLAQTELQAAYDERAAAAKAKKAAASELATKNAAKEAASSAMATTQTVLDTAATNANAAAKSLGAKITGLMTLATKKLTAALMSNVWTLALTAIVALSYGIYKLITYQTEAEKWQGKLNDRFREFTAETAAEQVEIDRLFGRLDAARKGTKEYEQAKQAIIDKYGTYLKGLGDEVERLNDVTRAYEAISAAAKQAALDRAISDARSEATDTFKENQTEHLEDLKEAIEKKISNTRDAEALYQTIVQDLRNNGSLSDEAYKVVQSLTKTSYTRGADGRSRVSYKNPVHDAVEALKEDNKKLNAAFADIEKKFGTQSNDYLQMTSSQIEAVIKKHEEAINSGKSTIAITLDLAKAREALAKVQEKENHKAETVAERKARWTKELKEAEEKLKELKADNSTATEEEINKQKQLVDKLKKSLGLDKTTVNAQNKKDHDKNRQKVEIAEREREIAEYRKKVGEQVSQAEIEIAQARIDAMEEGSAKEKAQIDLNYKKLVFANQQRSADMVRALQEAEKLAWENEHPDYKNEGLVFKPTKTEKDLSSEQVKTLEAYTEVANLYREKAESNLLKSLEVKYQDYTDQRLAIEKKFNDDLAVLAAAKKKAQQKGDDTEVGKINRSIAQATKEKGESLIKLDFEQLKKSPEYIRAFENLKQTSTSTLNSLLEQLEGAKQAAARVLSPDQLREYTTTIQSIMDELMERNPFQALADRKKELAEAEEELAQAKKELEEVNAAGGKKQTGAKYNPETGKMEKTYITTIEVLKKYNKAQDKVVKKDAQVRQAETKVTDAVGKLSAAISDVGESIGGLAGEIVGMIGSIGVTVMTAIQGLSGASQAASAAIQAVEKASVILAIIGMAIQLATKVASFFAADYSAYNKAKEAYESYVKVLDTVIEKQKELMETMTGENAKNAYDYAIKLIEKQSQAARELGKDRLNAGASAGSHSIGVRQRKNMSDTAWNEAKNALGKDFYNFGIGDGRMTGLFDLSVEQLEKLQKEAPLFWSKLDGDVRDYLESIIASGDKIEEMNQAWKESLTNISFDSVYDSFLDMLYDMDFTAKDKAKSMGDNMRKALIKNMFDRGYKEKLKEWYDMWADSMEDGIISEDEQGALDRLKNSIISGASAGADLINEQFKDLYDEDERESSAKGIATASQESVDELSGRATVIQGHTYTISEGTKTLAENSSKMLIALLGIEANTSHCRRLEKIEKDMGAVKDGIETMNLKGITLKR